MAWKNPIKELSWETAEDLSGDQFHFMVLDSDQIRRPNSATERAIGVLQTKTVISGDSGVVMVAGVSKVCAAEALAVGDFVKPEYVGAADAGKAVKCSAADPNCAGQVIGAADAEDELATILLTGPVMGNTYGVKRSSVATVNTAGAATYTAAQLLGGLILRDPAGGARSDVTPTAALLIAAIAGAEVGDAIEFTIRNTADAAETITVTAGTGVTLSGTMTIAQNNSKRFMAVVTAATTVTIYSLGTVVH